MLAAGYQVFAINPMSAARYRERHGTPGPSDIGDAHVLAEIVRVDRAHHCGIAGDSGLAERSSWWRTHRSLVWDRQRQVLRLRRCCGSSPSRVGRLR